MIRRVLGHVSGRAAILASKRQSLQQPKRHEHDRSSHANSLVDGNAPNQHRGAPHDRERDQKGVLAAHSITHTPKQYCPEGPHREAGGKSGQAREEGCGWISPGEEQRREEDRKTSVEVEIVPFDHGADGGGRDHKTQVVLLSTAVRDCLCLSGHVSSFGSRLRPHFWRLVLFREEPSPRELLSKKPLQLPRAS